MSCVCAVAAAVLALRNNFDRAFMVAAVGAVCWFLSYRVQVREKLKVRDQASESEEELNADEE